jgi:hypothetical protein
MVQFLKRRSARRKSDGQPDVYSGEAVSVFEAGADRAENTGRKKLATGFSGHETNFISSDRIFRLSSP